MQVLKHGCQLSTTDISVPDKHYGENIIVSNLIS